MESLSSTSSPGAAPGGRRRRFFGIRARLVLLVWVSVLPLLGLLVWSAHREVAQERTAEVERARMQARLVAAGIDQELHGFQTLLDGLARFVSVAPDTTARNDAVLREIAAGQSELVLNVEFRGPDGRLRVASSADAPADASEQLFFKEAVARKTFAVGEPERWEDAERWTLTLARAVVDRDGQVAGVVGVTIDLVQLRTLLRFETLPTGGIISLIGQDRTIITRAQNTAAGIGIRRPPEAMVERALATHDGGGEFVATDGSRRIAGYSTCSLAPWTVYLRLPRAVAFAAAEQQFIRALVVSAVVLMVTLVLAWVIASRITGPLRQLAHETHTLEAGGAMTLSHVRGGGEVGQLATVINRMLAKLAERDVEVRQMNAALRSRVDQLQTLFDLLPVGVGIATDATGQEIRMNRALSGMFGLPPEKNASLTAPSDEAPVGYHVRREGRPLTLEELPIQRALRENAPVMIFEHTIVREDGSTVDVLLNAVPLRDADGNANGCVATFQDLTEHKVTEAERRTFERKMLETQKLESLGVLAGGIAHDFNNILTGILGNASLASLDLPANLPAQQNLTNIREGSVRAADLCKQMLAYSGKGRFVVQKLDLNRFVDETTHLLRISISKRAVLRFNLHAQLPPIEADATQIRQVIMNLVINASEAIGERSGVISVSTGITRVDRAYLGGTLLAPELPEGNYVYLEVSDNGCGMSAETQAKIFEPFFTTKFSGRGLGLAAVLGIVRGHRGALKVYSELGRGTTFKLLFPCAPGEADILPREEPASLSWRGDGCVLIVDDEETVRTTAALMVRRLGFDAALVPDGREAVEAFRANPARYRVVLMDLTMPHLDGEQTFNELRRLKPDVRVVLMSGFNEQEAVSRFTGNGLASFVQKPFQFEAVSAALRQAVEGRH